MFDYKNIIIILLFIIILIICVYFYYNSNLKIIILILLFLLLILTIIIILKNLNTNNPEINKDILKTLLLILNKNEDINLKNLEIYNTNLFKHEYGISM